MDILNILHLSDFHIGNFRYDDPATLAIKIADTLDERGRKVDVVIVSGDIFDGRSSNVEDDLASAIKFFKILVAQLSGKLLAKSDFDENCILFVPGNHDLIREVGREYEKFDAFIKGFYPSGSSSRVIVIDSHNFICDFREKKIAILGFNSCKIKIDEVRNKELEWIQKIDFSEFDGREVAIREKIRAYKTSQTKWDDFGYIDPVEMDNVFRALRREIPSHSDYNLIATFHHHFYPFPEINGKTPDASFVRNYTDVLDKFQKFNIQLVLHGHKHLSIQRAITDNKYFENPASIIYVLSAGSVGSNDVLNPSFQWLRVYNKSFSKLVDGEKYDFKDQELDNVKQIMLPPQVREEKSASIQLIEALQTENPELFLKYKSITDDFEQTIQDSEINKIIEVISSLLTIFKDIKIELRKNPDTIYLLLLSINYRVVFLRLENSLHPDDELASLLLRLENELLQQLPNQAYATDLVSFLSAKSNVELDKLYNLIIKNVSGTQKRISAYCSISLFFTDLLLSISKYGEYYFEREKLNHKVNIKLNKGLFYKSIPNDSISLEGNIDRRAIILDFKCKDPTVHKVAVLIAKDFEMRLDKFEESLKEIKLRLYYILPKVRPDRYDLENLHFDAYIPTLLPLLTGENLYKQKEVFIRELVQNAIDATLLRKELQPDAVFNTDINIELGTERRTGTKKKYFRITDNGIGMSKFTMERYFTSIGRSFYVSEEFDDLKASNNIKYNAISNFGIGFLSSFMVCQEVIVQTKHVIDESSTCGLEIQIPNYDGCFFVKNIETERYGTEITLYEDDRKYFDFKKFIAYIKANLLGLPVNINVIIRDDEVSSFCVPAFGLQRKSLDIFKGQKDLLFFIPFSEDRMRAEPMSWDVLRETSLDEIEKYGIWFNFSSLVRTWNKNGMRERILTANQGLKISEQSLPFSFDQNKVIPSAIVNYPSSFIQLDVSREKILKIKEKVALKNIPILLHDQLCGFLSSGQSLLRFFPLKTLNVINYFLETELGINTCNTIKPELFSLKISADFDGLQFSVVKNADIPLNYNILETCYVDLSSNERFCKGIFFLQSISERIISLFDFAAVRKNLRGIRSHYRMTLNLRRGDGEFAQLIGGLHDKGIDELLKMKELNNYRKMLDLDGISGPHLLLDSKKQKQETNRSLENLPNFFKIAFYSNLLPRNQIDNAHMVIEALYEAILMVRHLIFQNVLIGHEIEMVFTVDFRTLLSEIDEEKGGPTLFSYR